MPAGRRSSVPNISLRRVVQVVTYPERLRRVVLPPPESVPGMTMPPAG